MQMFKPTLNLKYFHGFTGSQKSLLNHENQPKWYKSKHNKASSSAFKPNVPEINRNYFRP